MGERIFKILSDVSGRIFTLWLILVGWWSAGNAIAQAPQGATFPEALKEIKQAAGMCLREDIVPTEKGGGFRSESLEPDLSCAIAPSELATILGRSDMVLVDVRNREEYATFHIPGVLNMLHSDLRSKYFLRNKTMVLIGNGKAERELYASCADLKAGGFKQVKVLRGGTISWLSSGQLMEGQLPNVMQSARLTASELLIESQFDSNLVLVSQNLEKIQHYLSFSVLIPNESFATVKAVIERRRKELKKSPLAAVVLVTNQNTDGDTMQRLSQALQPIPLLVYTDSVEAYVSRVEQQRAIWLAQARGPKKLGCGL